MRLPPIRLRYFDGTLVLRTMSVEDVKLSIEWAAREGWNPGLRDAECFYAADPEGFFLAEWEGQPVGTMSVVNYHGEFTFMGLYIVDPKVRGRGFGLQLFRAALATAGPAPLGFDGVLERRHDYEKWGFQAVYRNARYELTDAQRAIGGATERDIVPAANVPFEKLCAYDALHFPTRRDALLRLWIVPPSGAALVAKNSDSIEGFGVIRKCRTGSKIGPLFADTPEIANDLFRELCRAAGEGPVYLDIPEPNEAAVELMSRYAMTQVFATWRMYGEAIPKLPLEKIYGITSFELG